MVIILLLCKVVRLCCRTGRHWIRARCAIPSAIIPFGADATLDTGLVVNFGLSLGGRSRLQFERYAPGLFGLSAERLVLKGERSKKRWLPPLGPAAQHRTVGEQEARQMGDGMQKERGEGRDESGVDWGMRGENRVEGLEEGEKREKHSKLAKGLEDKDNQGGSRRRVCGRGWGAERPQRLERISVRGIHAVIGVKCQERAGQEKV